MKKYIDQSIVMNSLKLGMYETIWIQELRYRIHPSSTSFDAWLLRVMGRW